MRTNAAIPPKLRIIFPLDVSEVDDALRLVGQLDQGVGLFQTSMGLHVSSHVRVMSYDARHGGLERDKLCRLSKVLEGKLFFDGRFKGLPSTVARAVSAVTQLGARMCTVDCMDTPKMMRAAREGAEAVKMASPTGERPLLIGVTVSTSLSLDDLRENGIELAAMPDEEAGEDQPTAEREAISAFTVRLARKAQKNGLDGVEAPPFAISAIREACGDGFVIVAPGIRPSWAPADDHAHVMTPADAIRAGADYIVIGRPIRNPPREIGSSIEAAKRIADEIRQALG